MARRPRSRTCHYCGREFPARSGTSRYCSTRCRRARYRDTHREQVRALAREGYRRRKHHPPQVRALSCAQCGRGFTTRQPATRYCSRACQRLANYTRRRQRLGSA
jgi:predicted nucleic acid-binding Zn ribbon protein